MHYTLGHTNTAVERNCYGSISCFFCNRQKCESDFQNSNSMPVSNGYL